MQWYSKGVVLKLARHKFVLAVLSGVLLTLSFPKVGIYWLAWFALVPLLIALRNISPKNGFTLGLCAGLAHYLTLVYWLAYTVKTYGNLPLSVSLSILILLSFYLALFVALFSLTITRLCKTPLICFILVPSVWVSLEYIRTFLFTGFPWELLGYSQYSVLPLIQISDIVGVYGVSFLIAIGNCAFFLGYPVLDG